MEHVGIFKGLHLCDGGSVELTKGLQSREMETHRDRKQTRDCQGLREWNWGVTA